jgi:hypothetical protein
MIDPSDGKLCVSFRRSVRAALAGSKKVWKWVSEVEGIKDAESVWLYDSPPVAAAAGAPSAPPL